MWPSTMLPLLITDIPKKNFLSLSLYHIHPNEQHLKLQQRLEKENREENIVEKEWKHQKKNGEVIYVDLNSTAINYNGTESRLNCGTRRYGNGAYQTAVTNQQSSF